MHVALLNGPYRYVEHLVCGEVTSLHMNGVPLYVDKALFIP